MLLLLLVARPRIQIINGTGASLSQTIYPGRRPGGAGRLTLQATVHYIHSI